MRIWSLMVLFALALVLAGCPKPEGETTDSTTPPTSDSTDPTGAAQLPPADEMPAEEPAADPAAEVQTLVADVEGLIGQWEAKITEAGDAADAAEKTELEAIKTGFAATKSTVEQTVAAWATAPAEAQPALTQTLDAAKAQLTTWHDTIAAKLGGEAMEAHDESAPGHEEHSEGGAEEGAEGGEAGEETPPAEEGGH